MSIGDKDVTVGCDCHRRRPIEETRRVTWHAGLAECHQHLSFGTELDDGVALPVLAISVGDVDVALLIDGNAVREHEHAGAKALDQLASRVEF